MSSGVSGGGGYGEKSYWDQRYANEDKYEWYLSYAQFKGQLLPHLNVADYPTPAADDTRRPRSSLRVLVVGCGNSELSKQLFDDGFTGVESIDYSEVVVDKMNQTYHDTPELKCQPHRQTDKADRPHGPAALPSTHPGAFTLADSCSAPAAAVTACLSCRAVVLSCCCPLCCSVQSA